MKQCKCQRCGASFMVIPGVPTDECAWCLAAYCEKCADSHLSLIGADTSSRELDVHIKDAATSSICLACLLNDDNDLPVHWIYAPHIRQQIKTMVKPTRPKFPR